MAEPFARDPLEPDVEAQGETSTVSTRFSTSPNRKTKDDGISSPITGPDATAECKERQDEHESKQSPSPMSNAERSRILLCTGGTFNKIEHEEKALWEWIHQIAKRVGGPSDDIDFSDREKGMEFDRHSSSVQISVPRQHAREVKRRFERCLRWHSRYGIRWGPLDRPEALYSFRVFGVSREQFLNLDESLWSARDKQVGAA
ncbi:hypothetical protein V8F20_010928 [Naviculisporaceae sp. PSN 640]